MNIAYIITSLAQEGPGNVVMDLVKVMLEHQHHCTVFYFDTKPNEHIFPCKVQKISFNDNIHFEDFDIVHTHSLRPDIYAFVKKTFKCKTPLVCTIHNFVFNDLISDHGLFKGIIGGLLWQFSRLRNDRILVLNKTAFSYYKKWFGINKLRIAYNTRVLDFSKKISDKDLSFISSLQQKYTILCSICRVTKLKGLDRIIRTLPYLDRSICFLIIGDGPEVSTLKKMSEDLNVSDRVIFMGSRYDGYKYMPHIDVFCIPSHSEGFPLAMLEAACYGKPILASNLPVFSELFSNDEIVICKEDNVQSYKEGIDKVLDNKSQYGRNVKLKFDSAYSPDAFYQNHITIYKELQK